MTTVRATIAAAFLAATIGCGEAPLTSATTIEDAAESKVVTIEATPIRVTPIAFTDAGDPIVEFDTPGMHCGACAATIAKRIGEQETVVDVSADAETKVVRVTFVKDGFDAEKSMAAGEAIAAIADAGFGEATPIVPAEETPDSVDPSEGVEG